jgi:hypothetical protein
VLAGAAGFCAGADASPPAAVMLGLRVGGAGFLQRRQQDAHVSVAVPSTNSGFGSSCACRG